MKHNKSLHRTFDPLPFFATAKTVNTSNASELKRYAFKSFNAGVAGNARSADAISVNRIIQRSIGGPLMRR